MTRSEATTLPMKPCRLLGRLPDVVGVFQFTTIPFNAYNFFFVPYLMSGEVFFGTVPKMQQYHEGQRCVCVCVVEHERMHESY